ncbi:MAG TPA: PqqD family protein [Kiritimatiellia bacterium]|nr:PqqD family protein [Kiritimatiellia bacterium]
MIPPPTPTKRPSWQEMLKSRIYRNLKVTSEWNDKHTQFILKIPTKRPSYLFPPISWVVKPPAYRTLYLDQIGADLWDWCDGRNDVERVIELFAQKHNLTFHESRVSVTTYLKDLLKRGALAVAI